MVKIVHEMFWVHDGALVSLLAVHTGWRPK
jgi:hypothetical protein